MSIDAVDAIPELDAEAMFLCAAVWARDPHLIAAVARLIEPDDFERPAHQVLYTAWCEQVAAGRPHDAASLAARLADAGSTAVPRTVHNALRTITTLGTPPEAMGWHALDVATAAYRRSYATTAEAIAHAAAAAPTDDLFPILVEHGTRQRAHCRRLDELRQHLGACEQ